MPHYDPSYDDPWAQPPPPPSGGAGVGKILLIVFAIALGGGLCCVGSCVGLAILGFQLQREQIRADVRDRPVIQREIGTISTFELDFSRSSADQDPDTWVYVVKGDKGSGELWVKTEQDPNGVSKVVGGHLKKGGERFELGQE